MTRIKTFIGNKIKDKDIEFLLFVLFFIFMAAYLAYRLVTFAPWYDELYTYYFFISRGPIYSAIHWPVPNNHIGYSVLSGIIYVITHNSFLSLRGVSYLAALGNLILLFASCRKLFSRGFSLTVTALYSAMWLVNNLAVQGRGYTLAANMMLICLFCVIHVIQDEEVKEKYYVWWAIGLCMGFYVVTSSLYWVVPICLFAGICLLIFRRYRELVRLIIHSLFAALATALLYAIVWMAIGSNLLINEVADYAGYSHVKLIAGHPLASCKRGIDYMLATPYIQSVSREGYLSAFTDHWGTLLDQLFDFGLLVPIALFAAVLFAVILLVSRLFTEIRLKKSGRTGGSLTELKENDRSAELVILSLLVIVMTVVTPVVVMLQCKLPYFRVFSFYGAAVAIACTYVLYILFGGIKSYFTYCIPIAFTAFAIAQLLGTGYNESYGSREEAAYRLMKDNDLTSYGTVALTDCDLQYMYRFVYDEYDENTDISESDSAVIEKDMLDPDAEYAWENYYDYTSLPADKLADMNEVYKNEYYILYSAD